MQFSGIPFILFLMFAVPLYYALPQKHKTTALLIFSYYFYFSAKPEYLVLLLISTAVNYFTGYWMDQGQARKTILYLNLIFNIGLLFGFKYLNFFNHQINFIFQQFRLNLHIPEFSLILPIGISFYTFMAIGYILDLYWGDRRRDRNYLLFSLYLGFFPQILCGPIGRAKDLIPQFLARRELKYENFSNGFRLMLWGFYKKMVVADNLGVYVDAVLGNLDRHSAPTVILSVILYSFQLYADFSGYTDIARGVARVFGIQLVVNFRAPYVKSTSVTDYWNRNHISLTSWLRDYVYYPFVGTNTSRAKRYCGVILMFFLSGLWHGAGWMFILWGLIQGAYLIIEDVLNLGKRRQATGVIGIINRVSTFLLVSTSLLFFRLPTPQAFSAVVRAVGRQGWGLYFGMGPILLFSGIGLVSLILLDWLMDKKQFDEFIGQKSLAVRWSSYLALAMLIIAIGNIDGQAFIYFKF